MQFCFFKLGSCGFDSIPSDVGQMVVHQAMQGPVNTIETYLTCTTPPDEKGAIINFATWQSGEFLEITIYEFSEFIIKLYIFPAIHGFAHAYELKSIRKALYPERLPKLKPVSCLYIA